MLQSDNISQNFDTTKGAMFNELLIDYLFRCWRQNILALGVTTILADAQTPKVTKASAGMVLAM